MKTAILIAALLWTRPAHALFPEGDALPAVPGDVHDYQMGDEWGKKPVTNASLSGQSAAFIRAAKATARYGGGTAFYLGKYHGHFMMATNHHVMPNGGICKTRHAEFPLFGREFPCEKFFGEWD